MIDSDREIYAVSGWGIFHGGLQFKGDTLIFHLHLPFYRRSLTVEELLAKSMTRKKKPAGRDRAVKKKGNSHMSWSRVKKMMTSFQVKQLYINIDTDDFSLNGLLYPIAHWVRSYGQEVVVNFSGKNQVKMIIENRLFRIARAYFF